MCADYVEELLTNKEPRESFKEDVEWKRIIHDVRMKETVEDEIIFSPELFNETFQTLKKKGDGKYKSILLAGPSLLSALYRLFEKIWKHERKPDSWRD